MAINVGRGRVIDEHDEMYDLALQTWRLAYHAETIFDEIPEGRYTFQREAELRFSEFLATRDDIRGYCDGNHHLIEDGQIDHGLIRAAITEEWDRHQNRLLVRGYWIVEGQDRNIYLVPGKPNIKPVPLET